MFLGELINFLEKQDPELKVPFGFAEPNSYRGYYYDLAFAPATDVTFGSMLEYAKSALNQTFEGYKGGEYKMDQFTTVWIAPYGESDGDGIGPCLIKYMVQTAYQYY